MAKVIALKVFYTMGEYFLRKFSPIPAVQMHQKSRIHMIPGTAHSRIISATSNSAFPRTLHLERTDHAGSRTVY